MEIASTSSQPDPGPEMEVASASSQPDPGSEMEMEFADASSQPDPGPEMEPVSVEELLLTHETLDRSSPDLWPEQIPGLSEYVSLRSENSHNECQPAYNWNTPSAADMRLIQQLSTLSVSSMIMEVKKLHDLAYQLGVEEAKEMTRGKLLNIFKSKDQE